MASLPVLTGPKGNAFVSKGVNGIQIADENGEVIASGFNDVEDAKRYFLGETPATDPSGE